MENLDNIHIFKTDIARILPDCEVSKTFNSQPLITEWSVDCEDADCVLRVVSDDLKPDEIAQIVTSLGYSCDEMS